MIVKRETAADNRNLMKATFRPHSPDPDSSNTAEVEVIFELRGVGRTNLLHLISATRKDTREGVFLTDEQKDAILEAVTEKLADEDDSPMWEDE